jgi:hypothetical protein
LISGIVGSAEVAMPDEIVVQRVRPNGHKLRPTSLDG